MKKLTSVILGVIIFFSTFIIGCGNKKENIVTEPNVPDNFILRPVFELDNGELNAGTAFAAKLNDETVIVTAIHLFGTAGGLDSNIPASDLVNRVKKVNLTDAFTEMECGTSAKILDIPSAKPIPEIDKDVAAFLADKETNVAPLNISSDIPKVGDVVWLAASVIEGPEIEKKLHKAIVEHSSKTGLKFKYENSDLVLDATSGAPILNSNGEIVGINVGEIDSPDELIGVANPSYSFMKMIGDAIKNN